MSVSLPLKLVKIWEGLASSTTMQELTDEAIALRVQQGDSHAFGILVERYEAKMRRYAKKFLFGYEDAEDVVQDVFLKAFRNFQSFDATRSFSAWIYRIAHNEFINAIKKRGTEPLSYFDPDLIFPHPVAKETADQDTHDKELRAMLDRCLDRLDPKYREPLVLYYFEDLDYQSIADILHVPVSTVGVRLKRGKDMLRSVYQEIVPNSYAT